MPRTNKMTKGQYALLEDLFMGQFKDKRNNPRMKKSETLFELGRLAEGGEIVELGAYHGNGTIALAWGTARGNKCAVHTVDPYTPNHGWVGEPYIPDDEKIFTANVQRAGVLVHLHKTTSEALSKKWDKPISLLYWDIGGENRQAAGENMLADFIRWSRFIVPGGAFAVHEPGNHDFYGNEVINIALATGERSVVERLDGFIWIMRRNT